MAPILGKIGEVILGQVGDKLVPPIQHMCYLNSNITELETQLNRLKRTREDVQMGVDENHRKVRVVGRTVGAWLTTADRVITEAEKIIDENDKVKEGCLNGLCPNLKLHYSLSMKAVKKIEVVVDLMAKGVQYTQSSYSPPPPCLETITNRDFMGFESRRLVMEEIIKALKHDEINLIGVCGMGGVGKTTLVNEIVKRAKEDNHFDEVAIAVVSQEPNLTDVQASIAEMLGLNNLLDTKSPIVRADLLRRRLLQDNKKVLVILDDIWAEFNLQAMGIPLEGADKNFKLLYTSRTQDLWCNLQTKKEIPLEVLLKDEAWQLFREKAGDSADAPDLQPIAKQIVDECGCLPLALILIGSTLSKKSRRNHTKEIWEEMRDRLTCTSSTPANEQLSSCLALSYEYFEAEQPEQAKQGKRLFLLCCLFREDEEIRIEDLARYGLGLSLFDGINEMEKVRRRVLALVGDLKSSYLLLDGKHEEECVKVHDVVRDMGLYVASKFALVIHGEVSEWPKKDTYEDYTSISLVSSKITELPKRLTCPNLEFLLLDCMELKELPCQFFEGMGKLKVLVLNNFYGILALPSSLRNLHTLSLRFFYGQLDNVFGGLINLKTLSFCNSRMKELPEAIGKLVNLRLLDLTDTKVERIPQGVISRLVHLEELYFFLNKFMEWKREGKQEEGRKVNLPELEFLSNLNALEIYIRSDVIPKFSIFRKLKIYKAVIVVHEKIEHEEMDDIGDEEIEHEEIDDISSDEEIEREEMDDISSDEEIEHEEMDDIGDEEIEREEMYDISSDEEIERDDYNFKKECKRALVVRSSIRIPSKCGGIDLLLRSSDCLVLEGKGCNDLVQALLLRDGVDRLQQLKFLRIGRCHTPECLANTMNPVHLPIAHAPAIFPILKALSLHGLVNLREICGSTVPAGSFEELTFIGVQDCGRLRNLFQLPIVGCLTQVKGLIISSCGTMEEVIWKEQQEDVHAATNRIEFPKLEVLKLVKLPSLMGFCRGIDHIDFPQLKELRLKYIPQVNLLFHNNSNLSSNSEQNDNVGFLSLFPQKVSLPNLEVLRVNKLENLERLELHPLSVGSFSKLKDLEVRRCGKLLCVIPSQFLPMLRELQKLTVERCNSLEAVFELEGLECNEPNPEILSPLKLVKLRYLPKLNCISKRDPVVFKYIQTLTIWSCNSLRYVFAPTMMKSIPQLRKLEILSCEMLSRIVAEENGLGESSVDEIEFPHELPTSSFTKLKTLKVEDCGSLRSTFHASMVGGLANLSELVITNCSKMEGVVYWEEEIEDGQGRKVEKILFPLLIKLQLSNLPKLVSFFPNVNTTLAKSNDHLYNPMQPQPLFNEKVAFPCLKYLGLSGLQNVSDLWGSELPTSSFSKLKNLQATDSAGLRSFPCILWIDDLHNTTQGLQEVARLLYTNSGLLALGSNGTMTLWEWVDDVAFNPIPVTTRDFPVLDDWEWRSPMTNDVRGVNLEKAVPCMALLEVDSNEYYIISACGGEVSLFSLSDVQVLIKTYMRPPPASTFLAFYPHNKDIIAIGMEDSTICIYNHRKNKLIKSKLGGHKKRITGLAFSTKLNRLVSSGADAQLCFWRIDTWERLRSVSIQLPTGKACNGDTRVQFHSDQIRLLVSHETQLAIYHASKRNRIRQWVPQDALPAPISFAVYSCDSQLVYTSFYDGNIGVFDADSLTLACHIVPSIYLYPAMLSGSQDVYPRVIAAHPQKPNQFAIGLTNGFIVLMEPQESEGKWRLSSSTVDNGILNDRTTSSSNTSNHTPDDQNGVGPMARSMEKPKTLDDVTDKSKPWKVAETQCQLVGMPNSIDEAHKVARLLYTNSGNDVIALGSNGTMTLWKWDRSQHNPSGEGLLNSVRLVLKATASVLKATVSGLAMTNDVTGVNLEEAVPCMALSKYNYMISACGGKISLFNMRRTLFRLLKTFTPPPPASTFLEFCPRIFTYIVAIGMEDSTIRIYNFLAHEVKSELKGHEKRITGLAFSTNLNILVSSGADAQLCIWSTDTWEHLKSVPIQLPACKACNGDTRVEFHSDQIHLLVSHETQLAIYDASEMDCIRQWVPQDVLLAPISFAAYSCDSQLVYTSFCDGNIGVFDSDSLTFTCRIAPSIYLSPALLSG
ncbi:hypothetical protein RHGRI_006543 [Rhododendron griersonianum]|nr:hypothetical protein RHGRI_006543 [Rhododendron griersonianum]